MEIVLSAFKSLGLLINEQKSTFTPVQRVELIEAILEMTQARAFLPESRFHRHLSPHTRPDSIPHRYSQELPKAPGAHGLLHAVPCKCTSQTPPSAAVAGGGVRYQVSPTRPSGRSFPRRRSTPFSGGWIRTVCVLVFLLQGPHQLYSWCEMPQIWGGEPTWGLSGHRRRFACISVSGSEGQCALPAKPSVASSGADVSVFMDTTAMFYINKQGGTRSSPLCLRH